jgi:hypothetical protein
MEEEGDVLPDEELANVKGTDHETQIVVDEHHRLARHAEFRNFFSEDGPSTIEFKDAENINFRALGLYEEGSGRIVIQKGLAEESGALEFGEDVWAVGTDTRTIVRHETAHRFWFERLDGDTRFKFESDMDEYIGGMFEAETTVNQYSSQNASELFAESVAAITHPEYKVGMLPKPLETRVFELIGRRE